MSFCKTLCLIALVPIVIVIFCILSNDRVIYCLMDSPTTMRCLVEEIDSSSYGKMF